MVVAVTLVRMVQVALHKIVDMVAVRHGLMATVCTMRMLGIMAVAYMAIGAVVRVGRCHVKFVLVDVTFVRVMHVAVVQKVCMVIVLDGRVSAVFAMLVGVIRVDGMFAGHGNS